MLAAIGGAAHTLKLLPRVDVSALNGPDWSVAFIGDPYLQSQLSNLLFDTDPPRRRLGRVPFWDLQSAVDHALAEYPLVVCSLPQTMRVAWRPTAPVTFVTPPFIDHILDLRTPLDVHLRGTARQEVRQLVARVRASRLTWRTTTLASDVSRFYHQIYVPFQTTRHGQAALLESYDRLAARVASGRVVLVELLADGAVVGGNLLSLNARVAASHEMGLALVLPPDLGRLLPTAVFVAGIEQGLRHGCQWFHFGASLGSWSDPVCRAKRRWGARTVSLGRIDHPEWTWLARELPPGIAARVNQIGPVTFERDRCYVVRAETPETARLPAGPLDGADGFLMVAPGRREFVDALRRSAQ